MGVVLGRVVLVALAMALLVACDPTSVPVIGKPQTPKELTAMDAAKQLSGTVYVVQGGRIWRLRHGSLTALTPGDRKTQYPAVTADGQTTAAAIVSTGHSEIAIGGADFSDLRTLTTAPRDPHKASIDLKPALSPRGKRVAFISDRGKCCTDEQVWEGPFRPYAPRQVSTPPDVSGGDDAPVYLPDGSTLIFVAWRPVNNDARNVHAGLNQASVPSGKPRVLFAPGDSDVLDPAPSADGRLAFVRRRGQVGDVEIGAMDGADASQITSFGDVRQPVWSPDQHNLIFISQHAGTLDLWMMSADGKGDPKRLTWGADLDANSRPAWVNAA